MLKVPILRLAGERTVERPRPRAEDDLASVMRRSRAGEEAALRTLLSSLAPSMLRVVRQVLGAGHPEVEDTLQEATIALVRALPSFRGDCTARHFGCRIATFTAISVRRRRRLTTTAALPPGASTPAADADLDLPAEPSAPPEGDWVVAARRRQLLRQLLDELPVTQAEALVLHAVTGLTVEELAATTGVPLETARSRLRLGRAALRDRIAADPVAAELLEDGP